jgi:hypothetical protein
MTRAQPGHRLRETDGPGTGGASSEESGRLMFGHKDQLSDGVQANAVILSSKGYDLRGDSGGYSRVHLDLEVHFTDGTTAKISCKAKTADVGIVFDGQIVPIRYDDNDRSKVEIDAPVMKAQRTAHDEALRAYSIKRAQAELGKSPAPGPTPAGDALPTLDQIKAARRDQ